jgi:riboflavin synthase alpha subunit
VFTGIVREVGRVARVEGDDKGLTLHVEAPSTADGLAVGDSVSVAGVCLTAEAVEAGAIRFHAVPETLARTTLGRLAPGDTVNVEPALRAGEPLGGHIVQGHVDDLGTVASLEREGDGARLEIGAAESIVRYCVEKGSITVDGVSLTVAAVDGGTFSIALVPHTLAATTLGRLQPGTPVNLEVDVLAKYVERLLDRR